MYTPVIPGLGRQKQTDRYKLKVNLFYRVSSMPTRAMGYVEILSKKKKKKKSILLCKKLVTKEAKMAPRLLTIETG